MLYQFTVTCTENWSMRSLGQWIIENKVYLLSMLGQRKKVHDCDYVFGSSTKFQRRMNGFVKADIRSSSIKVFVHMHFAGLYLPVNPSATTVYTRSAFYHSLRFSLSLQSASAAFYTQSAFYPWSAVCSPQSAVFVLH